MRLVPLLGVLLLLPTALGNNAVEGPCPDGGTTCCDSAPAPADCCPLNQLETLDPPHSYSGPAWQSCFDLDCDHGPIWERPEELCDVLSPMRGML